MQPNHPLKLNFFFIIYLFFWRQKSAQFYFFMGLKDPNFMGQNPTDFTVTIGTPDSDKRIEKKQGLNTSVFIGIIFSRNFLTVKNKGLRK